MGFAWKGRTSYVRRRLWVWWMLIGTNPGAATLYVETAAGPTYRIQVQVNP